MNLTMCVIAFILTLALMIIIMPHFISYLKKRNIRQVTSEYALE